MAGLDDDMPLGQKAGPQRSGVRERYLLTILTLILASNYLDRVAFGLLLQKIKVDLHLSDTQLGLLTGIAFAFFYSIMGIPIARMADRQNRITIISITALLWSAMVALCSVATSFLQLALLRICVAVGEAGCIPPAHSLIGSSFSRRNRPRAISIYMMGAPLSGIVGYLFAGWYANQHGWRATFLILSVPGALLGLIAAATLREPGHGDHDEVRASSAVIGVEPTGFSTVVGMLWQNRSFRHLLAGWSIISFFGYGISQWQPTFFIRSYSATTQELGIAFAIIYGIGGTIGTIAGGEWSTRFAANDEARQLKTMAFAIALFGLASIGIYSSSSRFLAYSMLGVAATGYFVAVGPLFSVIQGLVSPRIRATTIAITYLAGNLIGMGLGPLFVGVLSDVLMPFAGKESVRLGLLIMSPGYFWGAWHIFKAGRLCQPFRRTGPNLGTGEGEHSRNAR